MDYAMDHDEDIADLDTFDEIHLVGSYEFTRTGPGLALVEALLAFDNLLSKHLPRMEQQDLVSIRAFVADQLRHDLVNITAAQAIA